METVLFNEDVEYNIRYVCVYVCMYVCNLDVWKLCVSMKMSSIILGMCAFMCVCVYVFQ